MSNNYFCDKCNQYEELNSNSQIPKCYLCKTKFCLNCSNENRKFLPDIRKFICYPCIGDLFY
jgi:hypothetical protein